MAPHFAQAGFETRRRRAVEAMRARRLDGLLPRWGWRADDRDVTFKSGFPIS